MTAMQLDRVGYRYPEASSWAFRNISLDITIGSTLRITGRNGSGKSTLLKAIAGVLLPTEGTIRHESGVKAGYMNQFAGEMLARELTVAEHFKAVSPADVRHTLDVMLREFDLPLASKSRVFVGHLSGGERQIIALLCTLVTGANVLCLDEFTSALDIRSTAVAGTLLERAVIAGKVALVIVSHSSLPHPVDSELELASPSTEISQEARGPS